MAEWCDGLLQSANLDMVLGLRSALLDVADSVEDLQAVIAEDNEDVLLPLNLKLGTRRRVAAVLSKLENTEVSSYTAPDVGFAAGIDAAGAAGCSSTAGAAFASNAAGEVSLKTETAAARRRRQRRANCKAVKDGSDDVKKWCTAEIECWTRETVRLANASAKEVLERGSSKELCIAARSAVVEQSWQTAVRFLPDKLHAGLKEILHEM